MGEKCIRCHREQTGLASDMGTSKCHVQQSCPDLVAVLQCKPHMLLHTTFDFLLERLLDQMLCWTAQSHASSTSSCSRIDCSSPSVFGNVCACVWRLSCKLVMRDNQVKPAWRHKVYHTHTHLTFAGACNHDIFQQTLVCTVCYCCCYCYLIGVVITLCPIIIWSVKFESPVTDAGCHRSAKGGE